MKTLIAAALLCTAAVAAPACTDSLEGQFIPHWEDPDRFFLTCWPVTSTPTTVWRDTDGNAVDRATLDFDDVLVATGCYDDANFVLVAEEVVLQLPSKAPASSDVQAVMGISGGPAWNVQTTTDAQFAMVGIANPPFTLQVGLRYTITNANVPAHPIQLIAGDNALGNDTVVLSQGATAGSMEGDAGVAWVDNGNDVSFTMTPSLAAAMEAGLSQQPMYRCGVHTSMMRAGVTILAPSAVESWEVY